MQLEVQQFSNMHNLKRIPCIQMYSFQRSLPGHELRVFHFAFHLVSILKPARQDMPCRSMPRMQELYRALNSVDNCDDHVNGGNCGKIASNNTPMNPMINESPHWLILVHEFQHAQAWPQAAAPSWDHQWLVQWQGSSTATRVGTSTS